MKQHITITLDIDTLAAPTGLVQQEYAEIQIARKGYPQKIGDHQVSGILIQAVEGNGSHEDENP